MTNGASHGIWIAGADGCPIGWVVAFARPVGEVHVRIVPDFADVLAAPEAPIIVAVDMPIGLLDEGTRACEIDARRLLGRSAGTVFPMPPRSVRLNQA